MLSHWSCCSLALSHGYDDVLKSITIEPATPVCVTPLHTGQRWYWILSLVSCPTGSKASNYLCQPSFVQCMGWKNSIDPNGPGTQEIAWGQQDFMSQIVWNVTFKLKITKVVDIFFYLIVARYANRTTLFKWGRLSSEQKVFFRMLFNHHVACILRTKRHQSIALLVMCSKFASVIAASWYGNAFYITGPLWGESTGHWWIPFTKEQWCC